MSATVSSAQEQTATTSSRKRRIVYVPWHVEYAGDFKPPLDFMNWSKEKYELFYQNHLPTVPFLFKGPTDFIIIYVRGHGRSGSDRLSPLDQEGSLDVKPDGLVEDMIEGGLPKAFAGRIKFYACESGLGGQASFACKCASLFRAKGFKAARFYGYAGKMTGAYHQDQSGFHKFVVPGDARARTLLREVAFDANDAAYLAVI